MDIVQNVISERQYLIDGLQAAGIKTPIFTSFKKMASSNEMHLGAVLRNGESYVRNGSKKPYADNQGGRCTRIKVFNKDSKFKIIIGDYTEDACKKIFDTFILGLSAGIHLNGNYVPIEMEEVEWLEEDDNILKSKIACQFVVIFHGGIYKDRQNVIAVNVNV